MNMNTIKMFMGASVASGILLEALAYLFATMSAASTTGTGFLLFLWSAATFIGGLGAFIIAAILGYLLFTEQFEDGEK